MELLSLELNENENHELFNNVKIITNIEDSDINIELLSTSEGNLKVRYFTFDKLNKKILLEKIVSKVTKLLVEYTKLETINLLRETYFYFDEEEVASIISDIEEEIDNDVKILLIIKNKFKEVLENSSSINLNGFINFRLKFIKLYANQIVERCVDSYLMKKEYIDFLNIIKLISESDQKEYDVVNIMCNKDKLQIYDKYMKKLNFISNMEFAQELDSRAITYDESIINSLLSISPQKVIIHEVGLDKENKEVSNTLKMIKKIFEGKLEICNGCKFCDLI